MLWNEQNTQNSGQYWEAKALKFLTSHGLQLLHTNFHCRLGEIDLIMREQNTFVFVEVKYRQKNNFGGAIAAVTDKKQQKIIKCAAFYLQQQGLNEYNTPCRFDVVAIEGSSNSDEQPQINWLKNAFYGA